MAFLVGKGGLFGPKSDSTYVGDAESILSECGAVNGVNIAQLVKGCTALVFVKTVKVAFWGKVQGGYGIMMVKQKRPEGPVWTAPCCLNMFGAGGGFSWGVASFKTLFVINSDNPIETFNAMQAQAGPEVDLKVNSGKPIGELKFGGGEHSVQALNVSTGIMLDLSLAGTFLSVDDNSNEKLYGRLLPMEEILEGQVAPPPQFKPLADYLLRLEQQAA